MDSERQQENSGVPARSGSELPVSRWRERTPARVFVGRCGLSYRTETLLALREDHAAAVDAVQDEVCLRRHLGEEIVDRFGILETQSRAASKAEFLKRPDLGRELGPAARDLLATFPAGCDLQVVLGDGLSAAAVRAQVPALLPLLYEQACERHWTWGRPFFVRYCRVGLLNAVGELLNPRVVVLLIGERPGLATAESLSAYMAYRPRAGHTDAQRNLISNIHRRGVGAREASARIADLAAALMRHRASGFQIKEDRSNVAALERPRSLAAEDGPLELPAEPGSGA